MIPKWLTIRPRVHEPIPAQFPRSARSNPIPTDVLWGIQRGTMRSRYRGFGCWKSPFDLALYSRLLQELRPRLIIELGSGEGGSALWFADHSELLDLNAQVYSFDLNPPRGVTHPGVTFAEGDIENLASSALGSVLRKCEPPILVVEDGPHTYKASRAALEFCDPYLKSGDYFVVEDGIVRELALEEYQDGPRRAVQDFLASRPNTYRVDRDYCDYFGTNMTWNPDGYLTKL